MNSVTLPALVVLSAVLTRLMIRVGALDHPVARSSHTQPTPKGGGVAIAAAALAGILLAPRLTWQAAVLPEAALGLAAVSYLDDARNLPFWVKMAAQAAAAIALLAGGGGANQVAVPGLGTIAIGWLGPPLSFLWLIFATNAVNFMDGLNGLAAGSAAVACLGVVIIALGPASWPEAVLLAGILGFLPFNYPAARIFMGDVGSQFLGFMLAGLALRHAGNVHLSAVVPLAMLPMLLDVALTLIRRWRRGDRLTQAHRCHVYQLASRAVMPAWLVTLVYWVLAAVGAACGAVAGMGGVPRALSVCLLVAPALPFATWATYVVQRAPWPGTAPAAP